MAISSSLYSAISGLNNNGNAMAVIGNNLANTNTIGFKSSRTIFSDMLSSAINGSSGVNQIGNGSALSTIDNIFSQGTFQSTSSSTDLAIEGDGFFVVRSQNDGQKYYTRAGAFHFDGNGYLINPEGYRVQGKDYDVNGNLTAGEESDIRVDINNSIPAKTTSSITLATNLNANSEIAVSPFDVNNPDTYNCASSATVYDSLGNTHMLTTYFAKKAENSWDWYVMDTDGAMVADSVSSGSPLNFNEDGTLVDEVAPDIGPLDWGESTSDQTINLTLNTTQYASEWQVISVDQDGYAAGNLAKIAISDDGVVTANYTNGERVKVSQITLAKFANPGGLEKIGNSLFASTAQAGPPRTGLPGSELGNLYTHTLEQSTVDMAEEFVKMITTQRGFQANSRVITTTDEMLNELINLKR